MLFLMRREEGRTTPTHRRQSKSFLYRERTRTGTWSGQGASKAISFDGENGIVFRLEREESDRQGPFKGKAQYRRVNSARRYESKENLELGEGETRAKKGAP